MEKPAHVAGFLLFKHRNKMQFLHDVKTNP